MTNPIDKNQVQMLPLSLHDLTTLQYLSKKTFLDAFADVNTEEDMQTYLERAFSESQLAAELQDPDTTFYFLQWQDKTIGYCKVKRGLPSNLAEEDTALEICRLYVVQEFQGQQFGQLMLEKIIASAQDQQLDFVWLGVWSQNPGAIRLYERNSFSKIGSYTFMLGNDPQTDFIMKRTL
ncbi:GNAT family N-acetyltransferase [Catalinimonas niigatensis]|uniref:GNAT family N-acetyltransferase n=1 Tax=Catalinimonas niigatensis TaxID=1397264 RepID=UPI00266531A1|nr:GNAT family N-acetyltransferase [Catalinimonas niigatensis]WPP49468.1 GNAT family N-acetyltransferase [Catalinimonas niigatensis]